jgi:two-component system sensor histidine kinase VicK
METQPSAINGDGVSGTGIDLRVFRDNDGLPVTYDAASNQPREQIIPDELSMLWHEILSPLTVIKGYTGTLLDLGHVISEEQKQKYLRGIESASNRMLKILEDLRDITQLGEIDPLMTRLISLPDVLRQTTAEMQSQTSKHMIKITLAEHLSPVRAEPERIEQVLTNLLTNAIKYSPEGGDIEIKVRVVQDEPELRSTFASAPRVSLPAIIVSIIDQGLGIPETELERIFQRFYRINNRSVKSTPGAGLGLYISRKIVESHGGRIWAGNGYQGGSIFNFSLPLEEAKSPSH